MKAENLMFVAMGTSSQSLEFPGRTDAQDKTSRCYGSSAATRLKFLIKKHSVFKLKNFGRSLKIWCEELQDLPGVSGHNQKAGGNQSKLLLSVGENSINLIQLEWKRSHFKK